MQSGRAKQTEVFTPVARAGCQQVLHRAHVDKNAFRPARRDASRPFEGSGRNIFENYATKVYARAFDAKFQTKVFDLDEKMHRVLWIKSRNPQPFGGENVEKRPKSP